MTSRRMFSIALIGAAFALAGCGGDDEEVLLPTPQAQLRAVHASADTPAVDVYVNGSRALQNVTFGAASAFGAVPAGNTRVQVTLAGQAASTAPIDVTAPLAAGRDYTAIAIGSGSTGATRLQAVLVDDAGTAPAAGQVKLRVVHGAPAVPAVDIFVTAPGAALPSAPTIAALSFGQQYRRDRRGSVCASRELPDPRAGGRADRHRLRLGHGNPGLAAGSDIVVVAVPETGTSLSPIQLLLAPKGGSAAFAKDSRAALRVAHFSPNVPAVDVFLKSPGAANSASNRVLAGVTFPVDSGFLELTAGTYDASVALAGSLAGVIELNGASARARHEHQRLRDRPAERDRQPGTAPGRLRGQPQRRRRQGQGARRSPFTGCARRRRRRACERSDRRAARDQPQLPQRDRCASGTRSGYLHPRHRPDRRDDAHPAHCSRRKRHAGPRAT